MTKDEQIKQLATTIAELQSNLGISRRLVERYQVAIDENIRAHNETNREATELLKENKRLRLALKRARYALPEKRRKQFDMVFDAEMGAK